MEQSVCFKELKHLVVKFEECYDLKSLSSMMSSGHIMRPCPAGHPFTTELLWLHQWFYLNPFYADSPAQADAESDDCGMELNEREEAWVKSFKVFGKVANVPGV